MSYDTEATKLLIRNHPYYPNDINDSVSYNNHNNDDEEEVMSSTNTWSTWSLPWASSSSSYTSTTAPTGWTSTTAPTAPTATISSYNDDDDHSMTSTIRHYTNRVTRKYIANCNQYVTTLIIVLILVIWYSGGHKPPLYPSKDDRHSPCYTDRKSRYYEAQSFFGDSPMESSSKDNSWFNSWITRKKDKSWKDMDWKVIDDDNDDSTALWNSTSHSYEHTYDSNNDGKHHHTTSSDYESWENTDTNGIITHYEVYTDKHGKVHHKNWTTTTTTESFTP